MVKVCLHDTNRSSQSWCTLFNSQTCWLNHHWLSRTIDLRVYSSLAVPLWLGESECETFMPRGERRNVVPLFSLNHCRAKHYESACTPAACFQPQSSYWKAALTQSTNCTAAQDGRLRSLTVGWHDIDPQAALLNNRTTRKDTYLPVEILAIH